MQDWLTGCERAFVSVAVGHNADSVRILLTGLGMAVYDAGLSALDLQVERVVELDPQVLYPRQPAPPYSSSSACPQRP